MKRDKLLAGIVISLSVLLMIASLVYLITDRMIPGLIPFCSAILMLPLFQLYRKQNNGKMYAVLFLIASVLNLMAGIMQIINAI